MQQITPKELKKKLGETVPPFLLDVREDFEHDDFDIGGHLIPLSEVIGRATEIPANKPVIVYCHRGIRSQIAIQRLEDKFAFSNLINLQGGLEKWER